MEDIDIMIAHFCNFMMDCHVVKVIPCLVLKYEYDIVDKQIGMSTGGISLISLSLNQGISSNT